MLRCSILRRAAAGLPARPRCRFFRHNYRVWDAYTLDTAAINRLRHFVKLDKLDNLRTGYPSARADADGFFGLRGDKDVAGHGVGSFPLAYT
jgi:hypothetical protein